MLYFEMKTLQAFQGHKLAKILLIIANFLNWISQPFSDEQYFITYKEVHCISYYLLCRYKGNIL